MLRPRAQASIANRPNSEAPCSPKRSTVRFIGTPQPIRSFKHDETRRSSIRPQPHLQHRADSRQ